jgi:hypothetical protein
MGIPDLAGAVWRKSSYSSGQGGECVELALLADGTRAVRNSKRPDDGVVVFTAAEMAAFFAGVRAGEFDRHT